MKAFIILNLLFLFLFPSSSLFGKGKRSQENILHAFLGVEHGLTVLGTARIGHKNFEAGLLNANLNDTTIGIAYIFNVTNSLYTELGLAAVSEKPGLFSAIGFEYEILRLIDLRFELNASSSYDNFSSGGFVMGANITF